MFRHPWRYIGIQAAVEFAGNAALNAAIGWYWTQGLELVPLWDWWGSAAVDLLPTGFGIGLALCLIFTWRLHRRLRAGTTAAGDGSTGSFVRLCRLLPFNPWRRALAIGLGGAASAVVLLLALQLVSPDGLARDAFIAVKALFAGVVALSAMLVIGGCALADGVTPQQPRGYWPHGRPSPS